MFVNLFDVLAKLLPGDEDLGCCAFDEVMYTRFRRSVSDFDLLANSFEEFAYLNMDKSDNLSQAIGFIKFLKKRNQSLYQEVLSLSLEIYLKSNTHNGRMLERPYDAKKPRSLPEINYDLLEPVLERGEIWRKDRYE
jgi:hypothetical protein